jgi:hypothetical protein
MVKILEKILKQLEHFFFSILKRFYVFGKIFIRKKNSQSIYLLYSNNANIQNSVEWIEFYINE